MVELPGSSPAQLANVVGKLRQDPQICRKFRARFAAKQAG
jgi:hypothetical protein